ncbi:uncharacterized protein LOC121430866 [Lytechinus variegatus]|uniref:uncharacterized protein LOC121430866 n=1 Tax=Lytechinus variegatus TaxID=7654 RepID=UPI001BB12491|nr:uncharacterized protein LOC121430866 [Lytechinus variegatus]
MEVDILSDHFGLESVDRKGNGNIDVELAKLELEKERLKVEAKQLDIKKLEMESSLKYTRFDLAKESRLVPKFCEDEIDAFFLAFEKLARRLDWPKQFWTLLIQTALVGKAQEVFSSLSEKESENYESVKAVILSAYELVPEAYRRQFREARKKSDQTYVELVREKTMYFDRWVGALKIKSDYESLREAMILEDFKGSLPTQTRLHVEEQGITQLHRAAVVSDEYELLHKNKVGPKFESVKEGSLPRSNVRSDMNSQSQHESKAGDPQGARGKSKLQCTYCSKKGHTESKCWRLAYDKHDKKEVMFIKPSTTEQVGREVDRGDKCRLTKSVDDSVEGATDGFRSFLSHGTVSHSDGESRPVVILRDTGSLQSLLVADVAHLPEDSWTGLYALVRGIGEGYISVPLYKVFLESDIVSGLVSIGVVSSLPMEGVHMLMGNDLAGERVRGSPIVSDDPVSGAETEQLQDDFPGIFPACAVTRSQLRRSKRDDAESVELSDNSEVLLAETFFQDLERRADETESNGERYCRSSLIKAQNGDPSLQRLFAVAISEEEAQDSPQCFYIKSEVLMRKWRPPSRPATEEWSILHQIVLPQSYRQEVLRMAHEIPVGGHLGTRKTRSKVTKHFFWPGLHKDVSEFCRSCHTCQMVGKPQPSLKPAPLIPIPALGEPFSRVLVDCVGPLPRTKSGCKYLLTIMDVSSRFPEAVPLRTITARTVLDALLHFFTRYGLPKEIQSDQGSNFMSGVFKQVMSELGVHHLRSTAYHPQSQGAIERFHQTLKTMIKAYCADFPDDWDKGIPFLLFAIRDAPNESTTYTPFELVFGHEVRGPLKLVKEKLLEEAGPEECNILEYVSNFRGRLSKACDLAREHLRISQKDMKVRADRKAKVRSFSPGDKVLVLLPIPGEPLKARFSGPYVVIKQLNSVNYVVSTPDRRKCRRVCHINMLKRYYERESSAPVVVATMSDVAVTALEEDTEGSKPCGKGACGHSDLKEAIPPKLSNSETVRDLDEVLDYLPEGRRRDIIDLIGDFPSLSSDVPGRTSLAVHDVDVGDVDPIKQHPYRLNPTKRDQVRAEVQMMLNNDIIEPSKSSWSSPIVLVPKPDGSQRFCIDYRKVNNVTKTDCYPLPRLEDCIDRVGNAKCVSKIDLLKGYWQVPLTDRAKEISAFATPDGFYQCKVMPFGLKNAPATFQRLMNEVTRGIENCVVYIDDIIIFSDTWESHLSQLRNLFERLVKANLVLNIQKSEFMKARVTYLGHIVGHGVVAPRDAKVEAILAFPRPTGRREILRFLGMCGFYRRFVPNFSSIAVPLTDLLKKGVRFVWSERCQQAFDCLKAILTRDPVLAAPDFSKPFKLAIDASDIGVGAVLFQADDNKVDKPVGYFSRKLNGYQRKYSTVEKETLGLVLAVQHFEVYVTSGVGDVQVYTDHNPLSFLDKFRDKNQRLFRWSHLLQPYPLKIEHISGKNNIIADALSRV